MVLARFEQLIGAAGDVKELEYVAALHQTDVKGVRTDASIRAEDVRLFLSSRYGIVVSDEQVRDTIFAGLAGGSGDDSCLDLMEVVAILLIPTLLKASHEQEDIALPNGVVKTPRGMLEYVLRMILHDVTGSSAPKKLTPELIRSILVAYGECDLAADENVIKEMMEATGVLEESQSMDSELDVAAFAQGLTHDLELYDLRNEVRLTTNIDDVFLSHRLEGFDGKSPSAFMTPSEHLDEAPNLRERLAVATPVERKFTIPMIDLTAGTYRSKSLVVCLWATILLTYFAYMYDSLNTVRAAEECDKELEFQYAYHAPWIDNKQAMVCEAGLSILGWLAFFAFMCVFGVVCGTLGSIGNSVDCRNAWKPLIGFAFVLTLVLSFYASEKFDTQGGFLLSHASLILGLITCCLHLSHAFTLLVPRDAISRLPKIGQRLASSTVFAEMRIKRAAALKLATMTGNALDITQVKDRDHVISTHYGQALQTYAKSGRKYRLAGGLKWAWKRILGRKEFAKDGIWLPARFVAANIAQYVVAIYTLLAGISLTGHVADNYDSESSKNALNDVVDRVFDFTVDEGLVTRLSANVSSVIGQFLSTESNSTDFGCSDFTATAEEILSDYCPEGDGSFQCNTSAPVNFLCPIIGEQQLDGEKLLTLLAASGLNEELLRNATREVLQIAAEESVESLYPSEKYMVVAPMAIGTIVAFLTALYLAVMYIPSVATNVLKLRCGNISTLHDKNFNRLRFAPDQVSILTGSLFWGTLVSSVVVGGIIALVVFVFMWQATAYFAQRFVAIVIGLISIVLIRLSFLLICRCTMYRCFYREKPAAANLSMLALEWANFSLSFGFVFMRMIKLLLAAGACIGRIDVPFLAPGVGRIGRLELDNYPIVNMKDVLSHEAHRHPYIEQLGVIYLMKLRYAKHFGQRAGSCWRLIFVYALMPWLHEYRVLARPEQSESQPFLDAENHQPTSLQYISVHNIFSGANSAQYNNNNNNNKATDAPDDSQNVVAKSFPRTAPLDKRHVRFSDDTPHNDNDFKKQVAELEEENARLKAALAEALSGNNVEL